MLGGPAARRPDGDPGVVPGIARKERLAGRRHLL
jgi:hypothetical protein